MRGYYIKLFDAFKWEHKQYQTICYFHLASLIFLAVVFNSNQHPHPWPTALHLTKRPPTIRCWWPCALCSRRNALCSIPAIRSVSFSIRFLATTLVAATYHHGKLFAFHLVDKLRTSNATDMTVTQNYHFLHNLNLTQTSTTKMISSNLDRIIHGVVNIQVVMAV